MPFYAPVQPAGINPLNRLLACRIYRGYDEQVRLVEGYDKTVIQGHCSSVSVRLKNDDHPVIRPAFLRGCQCCGDLSRMMSVVINKNNPVLLALDLEASLQAAQILKAFPDMTNIHIKLETHRYGCQRVKNDVISRHAHNDAAQGTPVPDNLEIYRQPFFLGIPRPYIRLRGRSVRDVTLFNTWDNILDLLIVHA